jgi:hypothetical protein
MGSLPCIHVWAVEASNVSVNRTRDVGRRAQPLLALVGYDLAFPFGPLPGRPRLRNSSDERHQPRRDCVAQEGDQRRHQGWWRRTDATRGLLAVPQHSHDGIFRHRQAAILNASLADWKFRRAWQQNGNEPFGIGGDARAPGGITPLCFCRSEA